MPKGPCLYNLIVIFFHILTLWHNFWFYNRDIFDAWLCRRMGISYTQKSVNNLHLILRGFTSYS